MRYFIIFFIAHEQSMVDLEYYTSAACIKAKLDNFPTLREAVELCKSRGGEKIGVTGISEVDKEEFDNFF